jgi:hypothetical protein
MKTFRFDATILNPTSLSPDVRESFESRLEAAGASDLRVDEDEDGRAVVSFLLDASCAARRSAPPLAMATTSRSA